MDIFHLSALELGRAIRRGEVSPTEVTDAALALIGHKQEQNNAFITIAAQQAMQRAKVLESHLPEGVLAGVPMGVKDNICTSNMPTTCACKMLSGFRTPYDAAVIERVGKGGAVVLGKLNMDEFAMGSTSESGCVGAVKNPWDFERSAGGSSGGAAAAVAAGECWYALGSDTGGSVRQPAAHCGVTGMKPTYGTVSRSGLIAYASSLEQIGPIARTAEDCAAVLDLLQGRDDRDSTTVELPWNSLLENLSTDLRGMRIGIPRGWFEGVDEDIGRSVLEVGEVLRQRGARVEECVLPMMDFVIPAYYIIACAEASSNLSRYDGVKYGHRAAAYTNLNDLYCASRSEGFGREVRRRIMLGTFVLSAGYYDAYYLKAQKVRGVIKAAYDTLFEQYDLLLTPVTAATAPRLGAGEGETLRMYQSDVYTVGANLAGLPAISIPCGFDSGGMPIGAQLIGRLLGEQRVLNAAHAYQQDTDHHRKHPGEVAV